MEAIAKLNNNRGSARKARLVADLIRGKDVYEALNILHFSSKHASSKMEKLLGSAINNWEQKNEGLKPEDSDLFVKVIKVDGGKMQKRFQPAPFGRAHRIRKRSNHITIIVASRKLMQAENEAAIVETNDNQEA